MLNANAPRFGGIVYAKEGAAVEATTGGTISKKTPLAQPNVTSSAPDTADTACLCTAHTIANALGMARWANFLRCESAARYSS